MRTSPLPLALAGTLALALTFTGCTDTAPAPDEKADVSGHGHLSGAEEVAEPLLGITSIDETGRISHLDLLSEEEAALGHIDPTTAVSGDGRYLFAQTDAGVAIIDSGRWTWDHVDHFHYYRAEARVIGTLSGTGAATIATTTQSTSGATGVFFASGEAVLLDTAALSRGDITSLRRWEREPHAGLVVPVGSFALVTDAVDGIAETVRAYDDAGAAVGEAMACPRASGTIATRVGAVIGCADGAVLATVTEGVLTLTHIPYPSGSTAGAATSFANREGRPRIAGLAPTGEIWVLNTRSQEWTLVRSAESLVHVSAVDDDAGRLLALTQDGRVLVLRADGSTEAATEPLAATSFEAGFTPLLAVDQARAYLTAPADERVYEIDYADGARVARTFHTVDAPVFATMTGR